MGEYMSDVGSSGDRLRCTPAWRRGPSRIPASSWISRFPARGPALARGAVRLTEALGAPDRATDLSGLARFPEAGTVPRSSRDGWTTSSGSDRPRQRSSGRPQDGDEGVQAMIVAKTESSTASGRSVPDRLRPRDDHGMMRLQPAMAMGSSSSGPTGARQLDSGVLRTLPQVQAGRSCWSPGDYVAEDRLKQEIEAAAGLPGQRHARGAPAAAVRPRHRSRSVGSPAATARTPSEPGSSRSCRPKPVFRADDPAGTLDPLWKDHLARWSGCATRLPRSASGTSHRVL
jgi:hypothetical protein